VVFSSVTFLFFFLPMMVALHSVLPRRLRNGFLLTCSLVFYSWGELRFLWVMFASCLLDYFAALVIGSEHDRLRAAGAKPEVRTRRQRAALAVSLVGDLGLLAYFKYSGFFIDSVSLLLQHLGLPSLASPGTLRLALPLGISFYTFQSLSYTIDVFRGTVRYTSSLVDFLCFVTLFPHLVAGPIIRYEYVAEALKTRQPTLADAAAGMRLFVVGLAKKMLIANTVALPADAIFGLPPGDLSPAVAWLGAVCFTLQLYYDFGGYSDMAVGIGRILGFQFPGNFNYPYISRTATEFWQRWHITLSLWLRDYVFWPIGGYRHGRPRAYLNLLITFLLCGLWHGAAPTFVLFGFISAVLIIFERMIHATRYRFFRTRAGTFFYTLPFTFLLMVVFRSDTVGAAVRFLAAMVGRNGDPGGRHPLALFTSGELSLVLAAGVLGAMPFVPWLSGHLAPWPRLTRAASLAGLAMVLVLCQMKLAAGTYNPFIYFRF
jgi:alginate O-acetyltransferase complex protein AlgI